MTCPCLGGGSSNSDWHRPLWYRLVLSNSAKSPSRPELWQGTVTSNCGNPPPCISTLCWHPDEGPSWHSYEPKWLTFCLSVCKTFSSTSLHCSTHSLCFMHTERHTDIHRKLMVKVLVPCMLLIRQALKAEENPWQEFKKKQVYYATCIIYKI